MDSPRVGVAIASRDRRDQLLATVARLRSLPERPPLVVVDDASSDGTAAAVAALGVDVVRRETSAGAAARTEAVARLRTPYVALCDDDSWFEPGALAAAAARFDADPRLGLLAARVRVGPERREDPVNALLRDRPVLGFLACGAIVRREAFLAVGGFHPRYGIGGEERLLALDLAAAGWRLAYAPEVVARHCPPPSDGGRRARRRATATRNDLWTAWLRRPARRLPAATAATVRGAGPRRASTWRGLADALAGLPWVARERRALPPAVERDLRLVERPTR